MHKAKNIYFLLIKKKKKKKKKRDGPRQAAAQGRVPSPNADLSYVYETVERSKSAGWNYQIACVEDSRDILKYEGEFRHERLLLLFAVWNRKVRKTRTRLLHLHCLIRVSSLTCESESRNNSITHCCCNRSEPLPSIRSIYRAPACIV